MSCPDFTFALNSLVFLRDAQIAPKDFREDDARWKYPEEINLPRMSALGLGTQMQGIHPAGAAF